jgi:hypothetical protein
MFRRSSAQDLLSLHPGAAHILRAEVHLGFDVAEARFDFPTLPKKFGQLLGGALKWVLQRGEQVKGHGVAAGVFEANDQ